MSPPRQKNPEDIKKPLNLTIHPKVKQELFNQAKERDVSASQLLESWVKREQRNKTK